MRNYELEYSDICGLVNTANFFITGFPFFHITDSMKIM